MSEITPYWCSDSPLTGTYVATACPHMEDELREPLDRSAQLFRVATDNFIEWTRVEQPLQLDSLDFSERRGWLGFNSQLVERYRASHWELINTDDDYRQALGEAYDDYNALKGNSTPQQSEHARRKRQLLECHHMIKVAVYEGLATTAAAFAVVPEVVALRRPDHSQPEQADMAVGLLPAAKDLSRHLARNSKKGNDTLLKALSAMPTQGKVDYGRLLFKSTAFDIRDTPKPAMHTVGSYYDPIDLAVRYRGCPALIGGSISRLNTFIANTIVDNDCYKRALAA